MSRRLLWVPLGLAVLALAACDEDPASDPDAPAVTPSRKGTVPVPPTAAAPAVAEPRGDRAPPPRRRAETHGSLDLTGVPAGVTFRLESPAKSVVVAHGARLAQGRHRLRAESGGSTLLSYAFGIRAGETHAPDLDLLRAALADLRAEEELRGAHECRFVEGRHDREWMVEHQSLDGSWSASRFPEVCGDEGCGGRGFALPDRPLTAVAVLGLLGAGETHHSGSYKGHVEAALRYLKGGQDATGWFVDDSDPQRVRHHAMATLALTEAYGLTGSRLFRDSARRGVSTLLGARRDGLGWPASVGGLPDVETSAWAAAVVRSAEMGELGLPADTLKSVLAGLDAFGNPAEEALHTARDCAMLVSARTMLRETPADSAYVRDGIARLVTRSLPLEGATDDPHLVLFGTFAAFQAGGTSWRRWNAALETAVVDHQVFEKDSPARGSWGPRGTAGSDGGRVYTTGLLTLALEVYYRYDRVFGNPD